MLHGTKNMTCDEQGYIYWKGYQVEHFNNPNNPEMAEHTKELDRRCNILEGRGIKINTTNAVWEWDEKGNGDRWEIAFDGCDADPKVQEAAKRICGAYGIRGICDPAYIANIITDELRKEA